MFALLHGCVCLLVNDIYFSGMVTHSIRYYLKGSVEELIKQELQAVAEGVAASVFQSATHSNPESSGQGIDESGHGTNHEREAQDGDVERQHKAKLEVLNLLFHGIVLSCLLIIYPLFLRTIFCFILLTQGFKSNITEMVNVGFPVSDGIGRLQVEDLAPINFLVYMIVPCHWPSI